MSKLSIDWETKSAADLKKTGARAYAEHETTDVLVACYAFDDDPVETWRPGDPVPERIRRFVEEEDGEICAFNALFEKAIWDHVLGPKHGWPVPPLERYVCTAAASAAMALPRTLAGVAEALALPVQKDDKGRRVMLQLSRPRKVEEGGVIVWWTRQSAPEKFAILDSYCANDVEVERAMSKRVRPLPDFERQVWLVNCRINERGLRADLPAVRNAKIVAKKSIDVLNAELQRLTDYRITTVNQSVLLADWLREQGVDVESVDKAAITGALAVVKDRKVRRVLEIRQEAAKSSTAKLDAFEAAACRDSRIRGTQRYHAAGTGRFGGELIQPQNFPRPRPEMEYEDTVAAIDAMRKRDPAWLELWGRPLHVVADCLRGMIVAEPGHELVMADFSNIEGRVLAWLAGEDWKLQAFADYDAGAGPDIYKLAYSRSFGVAVDAVTKDQRQIGKVQELALGYQGGVGAFQSMAKIYGIEIADEAADEIKVAWREAHPATRSFWYAAEDAAFKAVLQPGRAFECGRAAFASRGGVLWCKLPSGRLLAYVDPRIQEVETPWGEKKDAVTYMGVDSLTRQWKRHKAYGGLWVENITQAVARDIMAEAMVRIEARGWPIVLSVHDELVSEVPVGAVTAEEYGEEMRRLPTWADGLPVAAEGLTSLRYRK